MWRMADTRGLLEYGRIFNAQGDVIYTVVGSDKKKTLYIVTTDTDKDDLTDFLSMLFLSDSKESPASQIRDLLAGVMNGNVVGFSGHVDAFNTRYSYSADLRGFDLNINDSGDVRMHLYELNEVWELMSVYVRKYWELFGKNVLEGA